MKKFTKDIVGFGASSIFVGGAGIAAGAVGGGAGVAAVGSMMPAVGTVMVGTHLVRMTAGISNSLPKPIKLKKNIWR